MKYCLSLMFALVLFCSQSASAAQEGVDTAGDRNCRIQNRKDGDAGCRNSDGTCSPEMRGRCGKRRGDWYGARQPVNTPGEARTLISSYFAGQGYTVSDITEKRWGFKAEILDRNGTVIDRVMIDKRTGRLRSLY